MLVFALPGVAEATSIERSEENGTYLVNWQDRLGTFDKVVRDQNGHVLPDDRSDATLKRPIWLVGNVGRPDEGPC